MYRYIDRNLSIYKYKINIYNIIFKVRQAKSKLKGLLSPNTIHFFLSFWEVLLRVQLSRYIVYLGNYLPVFLQAGGLNVVTSVLQLRLQVEATFCLPHCQKREPETSVLISGQTFIVENRLHHFTLFSISLFFEIKIFQLADFFLE